MAALTRADYESMWTAIKKIESYIGRDSMSPRKQQVFVHVDLIKLQIQEVIGQME